MGSFLNSCSGIGAVICYKAEKVPSSKESLFIPSVAMDNACLYTSLKTKEWNCINRRTGIQNTFQRDIISISRVVQLVVLDQITKAV